jgi:hypothetical protein
MACDQAGLRLQKIYPRFDAFSWLMHRLLVVTGGTDENSIAARLSPTNDVGRAFDEYGQRMGRSIKEINLLRLMFCSHFTFLATRP